MNPDTSRISLFKGKQIRRHWDGDEEKWYFSVIDVVEALSKSGRPRKYWNDIKKKLEIEESKMSEKIGQLKMEAPDGKKYLTDVADTETILRLIQSIPSPNAEPFKLWLARVGYERIEETDDPEKGIQRALSTYEISKSKKPKTFPQNRTIAKVGGGIAGQARRDIELKSGKKVISKFRFEPKSNTLLK
jgi:DNA-damage-inducible protein D